MLVEREFRRTWIDTRKRNGKREQVLKSKELGVWEL
jgi:hypothetical protein